MRAVPRTDPRRWQNIAARVEGRSAKACAKRAKELADEVKAAREAERSGGKKSDEIQQVSSGQTEAANPVIGVGTPKTKAAGRKAKQDASAASATAEMNAITEAQRAADWEYEAEVKAKALAEQAVQERLSSAAAISASTHIPAQSDASIVPKLSLASSVSATREAHASPPNASVSSQHRQAATAINTTATRTAKATMAQPLNTNVHDDAGRFRTLISGIGERAQPQAGTGKQCSSCGEIKGRRLFSKNQWSRPDGAARCTACLKPQPTSLERGGGADSGGSRTLSLHADEMVPPSTNTGMDSGALPVATSISGRRSARSIDTSASDAFPVAIAAGGRGSGGGRPCCDCGTLKPRQAFSKSQWCKPEGVPRKCVECLAARKGPQREGTTGPRDMIAGQGGGDGRASSAWSRFAFFICAAAR